MASSLRSWDDSSNDRPSRLDAERKATYLRRFVPAIAIYLVLIAGLSIAIDEESSARWVWYLLPAVPLLWIAYALVRDVFAADDYQRVLITRAMSIGFGTAMIAASIVGLLGVGGVSGRWGGWVVFAAGLLGWSISAAAFDHRSRSDVDSDST